MNMISKILSILFETPKDNIIITEGVESTWHYHLSYKDKFSKSLCGSVVMPTELPLESWGTVTHLGEKYCKKCLEIYRRENNE